MKCKRPDCSNPPEGFWDSAQRLRRSEKPLVETVLYTAPRIPAGSVLVSNMRLYLRTRR